MAGGIGEQIIMASSLGAVETMARIVGRLNSIMSPIIDMVVKDPAEIRMGALRKTIKTLADLLMAYERRLAASQLHVKHVMENYKDDMLQVSTELANARQNLFTTKTEIHRLRETSKAQVIAIKVFSGQWDQAKGGSKRPIKLYCSPQKPVGRQMSIQSSIANMAAPAPAPAAQVGAPVSLKRPRKQENPVKREPNGNAAAAAGSIQSSIAKMAAPAPAPAAQVPVLGAQAPAPRKRSRKQAKPVKQEKNGNATAAASNAPMAAPVIDHLGGSGGMRGGLSRWPVATSPPVANKQKLGGESALKVKLKYGYTWHTNNDGSKDMTKQVLKSAYFLSTNADGTTCARKSAPTSGGVMPSTGDTSSEDEDDDDADSGPNDQSTPPKTPVNQTRFR